MQYKVPRLIVAAVGLLLIIAPLIARPGPEGGRPVGAVFAFIERNFSVWFSILAVFAFVLGAASLLRLHGRRVRRRERDWPYSLLTLVAFAVVLVTGLFKLGGPPGVQGDFADPSSALGAIVAAVYAPLYASIFALLAFFVASAAYRAFRLHSWEAAVLLVAAAVVLLGRTPIGAILTGWLPEPLAWLRSDRLSLWLMTVPNTAGQRAILIGIGLGVVSMSLRLILGIERGPLGRGER
jgi:hypothetical protein